MIIKNLLNMHSRLAAAQAEFAAAHPSLSAAQAEEQPENVWQVLTSYRAMLAYAIILMVAVAAILQIRVPVPTWRLTRNMRSSCESKKGGHSKQTLSAISSGLMASCPLKKVLVSSMSTERG